MFNKANERFDWGLREQIIDCIIDCFNKATNLAAHYTMSC